jgi:uncharacterized membrane protein YoaT (DUF817 family)
MKINVFYKYHLSWDAPAVQMQRYIGSPVTYTAVYSALCCYTQYTPAVCVLRIAVWPLQWYRCCLATSLSLHLKTYTEV